MIKWSTYPLLFLLTFGIFEAVMLGYSYFLIFSLLLFFTVSADVVIFHTVTVERIKSLQVRRRIVPSAKAGWFDVALEFSGTGQGLLVFKYADLLSEGLEAQGESSGSIIFRGRGQAYKEYSVTSPYFGRHTLGPLELSASDPFGLCRFRILKPVTDRVAIPPIIAERAEMRGVATRSNTFVAGAGSLPRPGQGYQFLSIRPYTVHDESRRIAWNRFGTVSGDDVYVKEMEDERNTDTIFVIDYSSSTNIGQLDRIYCNEVSSALRASFALCRQGDRVGFFLYSSTRNFFVAPEPVASSAKQLQAILKSTEPDGQFDLAGSVRALKKRYGKSALTVVISPLMTFDGMAISRESVPLLSRRSVRLIVPEASTFFDSSGKNASFTLMRMVTVGRRSQMSNNVRLLNGLGVRAKLSSSRTLVSDLAAVWFEGRYSYAGY